MIPLVYGEKYNRIKIFTHFIAHTKETTMKGTRPLMIEEIKSVLDAFDGTYKKRNRSLFLLGISCGARISELLQLTIKDVWQNNKPVNDLHFSRNIVKGKQNARRVPLSKDGTQAITDIIQWHRHHYGRIHKDRHLFTSQKTDKAMDRRSAHEILKTAFEKAGLNGKLATHSMRKSYAQRLYNQTNDIFAVKEMLGHKSIATTQAYIGINYDQIRRASEDMSLHSHENGG